MQPTVRLVNDGFVAVPALSGRLSKKFAIAGAAMVTAGALVAGPVAESLPEKSLVSAEIQRHTVQLAAALSPTDSPLDVYPQIFLNTITNIQNLGQAIAADPFPILSQVADNQAGYGQEFFGAILAIPANWQKFSEGRGATYLTQFQTAVEAGDIGAAVTAGSSYLLYGLLDTLSPIYNSILTNTPRGSSVANPGIPQMMAQNLANAVGVIFSTTTWVSGIFTAVYGGTVGALAAAGESLFGFADSWSAGDVGGAINSLVNMPGLVVNALVNGWQHPRGQVSWPALLTYQNTGTYATTSIGLLGQLLVKIPKAIATAITPAVAPSASVSVTDSSIAALESDSGTTESASAGSASAGSASAGPAEVESAPSLGAGSPPPIHSSSADTAAISASAEGLTETRPQSALSGVGTAIVRAGNRPAAAHGDPAEDTGSGAAAPKAAGGTKKAVGSARQSRGSAAASSPSDSADSQ